MLNLQTQIFPLHLSRSIGTLANWSIVSVLLLPFILLTIIIRCPAYASQHESPITIVGHDILGSLGIMAFAFGCAQVNDLRNIIIKYILSPYPFPRKGRI
jgi:hypothetical protein